MKARGRKTKGRTVKARGTRAPAPASAVAQTAPDDKAAAALRCQLDEANEPQKASAEVLRIIANSGGELAPVFEAILINAIRLCDAKFGNLWLYKDGVFRIAALHGAPVKYRDFLRREPLIEPKPDNNFGHALKTKRVFQIDDLRKYAKDKLRRASVKLAGTRSIVTVPMLKDGNVIGMIAIYRQEVRAFTPKQIELVSNFAAQAVIAVENARLLNELRQRTDDLSESLEQQTATSEVLKVISGSPGELEPVFTAILENSTRICGAGFGNMFLYDGEAFQIVAQHNATLAYKEHARQWAWDSPNAPSPLARIAKTKEIFQIADLRDELAYRKRVPRVVALVELGGARTCICVPMLKDDTLVGAIVIYRREVRPFTDKQIELVSNFAAQAVIAIENTRLLNELRQRTDDLSESLEQQTATSEVLKVISSSPGELQPVFQAMLENATRICEAKFGNLFLREGDAYRAVAVHGEQAYVDGYQRAPLMTLHDNAGMPLDRITRTKDVVHIPDLRDEVSLKSNRRMIALVEVAQARTLVGVPMVKDDEIVGAIVMYRQEARPFSDKQIELVQNFAAQAVIAIENTRLLNELRQRTDDLTESLEQQTATSEVLKVISARPASWSRCSRPCWRTPRGSAEQSSAICSGSKTATSTRLRCSACRRHWRSSFCTGHNVRARSTRSAASSRPKLRFTFPTTAPIGLILNATPWRWPASSLAAYEPCSSCQCSRTTN